MSGGQSKAWPAKEPKSNVTKENLNIAVLPRTQVSGEPTPSSDRSQVFPEGFPVSRVTELNDPLSPPTFWGSVEAEGPIHIQNGHEDYWAWKLWSKSSSHPDARRVWAGFRVKGQLGETLHQVAETTESHRLIAMHLDDASIKTREEALLRQLGNLQFEPIGTVVSRETALLNLHGVADGEKILEMFHPASMTLLASIASENIFLVTHDFKWIDIAAHAWPIDTSQVQDCRTRLLAPVQFGDNLGVVAGCIGDHVILKSQSQLTVPIQDLRPVMVEPKYRKLIGGV